MTVQSQMVCCLCETRGFGSAGTSSSARCENSRSERVGKVCGALYSLTSQYGPDCLYCIPDSIIEGVVSQCGDVLKLMGGEVLRTEVRVLYEIVYVVNNSLRQHKPFRAVKQVQVPMIHWL